MQLTRILRISVLAFVFLIGLVTILGKGGGDSSTASPPAGGGAEWQPSVFMDASSFQNLCANPRSGIDPTTNQPFTDMQGQTVDENNFLRSYSDDTYLWYNEIVDQDPGLFSDPLVYFDELKTFATTSSGNPKDKFHFTVPSDEWIQFSQSGVSVGYGVTWVLISSVPPREAVVAYTEPNTPATDSLVSLSRGAKVLSIDGVDINVDTQAGMDTLYAGLFPANAGETHTFVVQDLGAQASRVVTMASANITSMPVQNVSVQETPTGRVGYLLFNDHIATAEQALIDAVNQLNAGQGISDLVIDIRYNGGGFLDIASEFAYMIAGPVPTAGRDFEVLQFNDKHPTTDPVTGQPLQTRPFHTETLGFSTQSGLPLPTLALLRVFMLTGPGTCSASESIMNSLRGVDVEVIQIGSTTCGKPYGFHATGNCGTSYFTIQFRGVNAKDFGDYTDGFSPANTVANVGTVVPGCSVADDFTAQLGDPSEGRFATALAYRNMQDCPAPSSIALPSASISITSLSAVDGTVVKSPWLTNRILRR